MATQPIGTWWLRAITVSAAVAAAAYLATVLAVGGVDVSDAVRLVSGAALSAILALSLVNYALRFLRWHWFLGLLGCPVPILHDLMIYVAGFALTTTPGKAGEMIRSIWLKPYEVPVTFSLAAFLTERLKDFLAVLLLPSLGQFLYLDQRWLLVASLVLGLAGAILLLVPPISHTALRPFIRGSGRIGRLARPLAEMLQLTRRFLFDVNAGGSVEFHARWSREK